MIGNGDELFTVALLDPRSHRFDRVSECVGADFRSLDREAEVAELAGCEPVLGWGVIYSYR